jgi:hypothetical protein
MPYFRKIKEVRNSAELLEEIHQEAIRAGKEAEFEKDLRRVYLQSADILLPQVWYSPYKSSTDPEKLAHRPKIWKLAILFSIINSLYFIKALELGTSRGTHYGDIIIFSVVPVTGLVAMAFIVTAQRKHLLISLTTLAALAGLSGYFFYSVNLKSEFDIDGFFASVLSMMHLILMTSIAIGVSVVGIRPSGLRSFALLKKSFEILVTFVFYIMVWFTIMGIISALFYGLDINLPDLASVILSGTFSWIPVLSIATVYDPFAKPEDQDWQHGLSNLISDLMGALLAAALVGLVIAIVYIPINFWKAFGDFKLIVYLTMFLIIIFVVVIEATPLRAGDISPRMQIRLRSVILSIAIMSAFVDLYAIASTIKRIVVGGWSFNRFFLFGWDSVIILTLGLTIYGIWHGGKTRWVEGIHRAFNIGTLIFIAWSIYFLTQGLRLFF